MVLYSWHYKYNIELELYVRNYEGWPLLCPFSITSTVILIIDFSPVELFTLVICLTCFVFSEIVLIFLKECCLFPYNCMIKDTIEAYTYNWKVDALVMPIPVLIGSQLP